LRYDGLVLAESQRLQAQLLVDLINTYYQGDQSDVLSSAAATRWLREHVGQPHRGQPATALAPVRDLREGLRQLALENNGDQPDRVVLARADAALRRASLVVTLGATDAGHLLSSTTPNAMVLTARAAVVAGTTPTPTPHSTSRQTASKLRSCTRRRSGRPSRAALPARNRCSELVRSNPTKS